MGLFNAPSAVSTNKNKTTQDQSKPLIIQSAHSCYVRFCFRIENANHVCVWDGGWRSVLALKEVSPWAALVLCSHSAHKLGKYCIQTSLEIPLLAVYIMHIIHMHVYKHKQNASHLITYCSNILPPHLKIHVRSVRSLNCSSWGEKVFATFVITFFFFFDHLLSLKQTILPSTSYFHGHFQRMTLK